MTGFEEMFLLGVFGTLLVMFGVLLPLIIVYTIATWKLFEKVGRPGWQALIPFYNMWILVEIADLEWW